MRILNKVDCYKNIREFAYQTIKDNILSLDLFPGQKITELELVDVLKIGKTPIREALIQLSSEGLIVIIPQSGSFVSKISLENVQEGRDIRCLVEEAVYLTASEIMTDEDIYQTQMILKQHQLRVDESTAVNWEYDTLFHSSIYKACNKIRTFDFIQKMNADYNRVRVLVLVDLPKSQQIIKEHTMILDAIIAQDREKIKILTKQHLNQLSIEKAMILEHYQEYFIKE